MAIRIQLRRDTAANWVSSNPVLRQGEIGIETDTLLMKLGNGTSTWTQITAYMNIVPDGNLTIGDYVAVNDIGASLGVVGLDSSKNALIPGSSIIVEGPTDNSFETTLTVTDPTADRTITFKNADGTVAFTSTGTFNAGNTFTVQMSDASGNFASPNNVGTLTGAGAEGVDPSGTINITIPSGTLSGAGYLFQVVADDPATTGSASGVFTITQTGGGACLPESITTGAVTGGPFTVDCAVPTTDNGTVAFTTTGVYAAGNTFTVQMSDASGSFAFPQMLEFYLVPVLKELLLVAPLILQYHQVRQVVRDICLELCLTIQLQQALTALLLQ